MMALYVILIIISVLGLIGALMLFVLMALPQRGIDDELRRNYVERWREEAEK